MGSSNWSMSVQVGSLDMQVINDENRGEGRGERSVRSVRSVRRGERGEESEEREEREERRVH